MRSALNRLTTPTSPVSPSFSHLSLDDSGIPTALSSAVTTPPDGIPAILSPTSAGQSVLLLDAIAASFNKPHFSDVQFRIGRDGTVVYAHKYVLGLRCPVFKSLFYSNANKFSGDPIVLEDIEPAAFIAVMNYLYSDKIVLTPETVMSAMLGMTAFVKSAKFYMGVQLSAKYALPFLQQATFYQFDDQVKTIVEFINSHRSEVMSHNVCGEQALDDVECFLKTDGIHVRAVDIFRAVVSWGKRECLRKQLVTSAENKRKVLATLLPHIRWAKVTLEDVQQCVIPTEVLTDKQLSEWCGMAALQSTGPVVVVARISTAQPMSQSRRTTGTTLEKLPRSRSSDLLNVTHDEGRRSRSVSQEHLTAAAVVVDDEIPLDQSFERRRPTAAGLQIARAKLADLKQSLAQGRVPRFSSSLSTRPAGVADRKASS
eukprot:TRINITY_DN3350_c0_g1_i2.p1 TRINITY_DN3350_c0_g1~~TRINITY_DN3350_c0_g1_i2.p1  ORF type:complete len:428 (+),score=47.65 TRINITY_DN3350_c0_g1_i2:57-1340(+)